MWWVLAEPHRSKFEQLTRSTIWSSTYVDVQHRKTSSHSQSRISCAKKLINQKNRLECSTTMEFIIIHNRLSYSRPSSRTIYIYMYIYARPHYFIITNYNSINMQFDAAIRPCLIVYESTREIRRDPPWWEPIADASSTLVTPQLLIR